ncbi:hypothetical protein CC99x_002830 [Candidatus Berkiella cookevillensis]|uniref:Uncharacterized protein n=1 Tax=Candidatus Berkiella cookevillensis TaxID=437022 RepID=A0A0Q9YDK7_9GAMM|nr:hypothetical protein [Candidatus Berkiella cookevillensis]MCS5707833.1 hypothetical protein [Candidatus Berkiella cookevillensis]
MLRDVFIARMFLLPEGEKVLVNADLKRIISDTSYVVPAMQGFIKQKSGLEVSNTTTAKMLALHSNLLSSFFNDDDEDKYNTAHLLYVWWTLFSRLFCQEQPKWDIAYATKTEKETVIIDLFTGSLLLAAKYSLESTLYTSDFSSLMIESMPQAYKNFSETTQRLKMLERQCLDALAFCLAPQTHFDTKEQTLIAIQQVQSYAKAYVQLKKYSQDKKSNQRFTFLHQSIEESILKKLSVFQS